MPDRPLTVLYEDNHLLAISKPAGLPTIGVAPGEPSLAAEAKRYLKHRYSKSGNVYLGVMSRLDAPVSGVILFAKTSKAAARLTEQFRGHSVEKTYWALVEGHIKPVSGNCVDWIVHDERHRKMRLASSAVDGAREARLSYRRISIVGGMSHLEIDLETGRKHQIRLQFSTRGHPIVGDLKYGSQRHFTPGIALHARKLVFVHPVRGEEMAMEAPLPPSWRVLGIGGP